MVVVQEQEEERVQILQGTALSRLEFGEWREWWWRVNWTPEKAIYTKGRTWPNATPSGSTTIYVPHSG